MYKKKTPPKGKFTNGKIRWNYTAVKNGTTISGFLAGQPSWAPVHFVGESKPCKRVISEGVLSCPYCAAGKVEEWKGYTPYYSPEYIRCFVLIGRDYEEAVAEIPLHAQVKISRGKGSKEPVVIVPSLWRTQPLPKSAERDYDVDLRAFTLLLWNDAELTTWALSHDDNQLPKLSVPKTPIDPVDIPLSQTYGHLLDRVKGLEKSEPVIINAEALPNGKYKVSTKKKP